MSQPIRFGLRALPERLRAGLGPRAVPLILTLLLEGLLALLLLTLAPSIMRRDEATMSVFSLESPPMPDEVAAAPAEAPSPEPRPEKQPPKAPPEQAPPPPVETPPAPAAPPLIPLTRDQMAAIDLSALRPARPAPAPRPAPQPMMAGPADTGSPGDSKRVAGQGPNGEPLYAAAWYREPFADELRGYLSTASGPGWGLIACRTVSDYRVEDCVPVAEYPEGSNITRAILAAAWQFRVRPPRVGGRSMVGHWVQIRIDYKAQRP